MSTRLLRPEDARAFLTRRYGNQHRNWLAGEGVWPLTIGLGAPTEKDVAVDTSAIRQWVQAWTDWKGPGEVSWQVRQWAKIGAQRLPTTLTLGTPAEVATIVGQRQRWQCASGRWTELIRCWPSLSNITTARYFDVLADYSNEDFGRLTRLLAWLDAHPASQLYIRQVPVEGLDTKWIEPRRGLITDLFGALHNHTGEVDFYTVCGLRPPPHRLRIRVLCPRLRVTVGGLHDVEAPLDELARLPLTPRSVIVVENLATGLALPDFPGCVAFMKLGNAVSVLGELPWVRETNAVYWGDVDTHGFAILDRARRAVPQLRSVLMDEHTLVEHQTLWGTEPAVCPDSELFTLTFDERDVYLGLRQHRWGKQVRLEQERLPWTDCVTRLLEALNASETVLA